MKKFEFLEEPSYRCFQLPNGKLVDVYSCRYDCKVDLFNETFIPCSDVYEYEMSNLPTFNDLVKEGVVKEVSCIEKSYDIDLPYNRFDNFDIGEVCDSVIKQFKENGFNVTRKAIIHNYSAWLGDMKSGYRDEDNGYHLFSPCGCNPLSFRATSLHKNCYDWQTSYEY